MSSNISNISNSDTSAPSTISIPVQTETSAQTDIVVNGKKSSILSVTEEKLNEAREKVVSSKDTVIGMGLMATASFCTSWMSVCVSIVASMGLCSAGSTFWRGILQAIISIAQTAIAGHNIFGPREKWIWLFLRGFVGGVANLCFFYAVAHMPIGDANTLVFTSPVFTALFAICLVGEKWHWLDIVCTLLTFVGVICVTKPSFIFGDLGQHEDYTIPSIVALISAVLMAFTYAIVKKIGKSVPTSIVLEYFSVLSMVAALIQTWILGESVWPQSEDPMIWLYIVIIMITGFLAQLALNRGLQIGAAGPVSAVRFLDIFFSYLWQILVMKQESSWLSILGACIMCCCIILIAIKKYLIMKADKSQLAKLEEYSKSHSPLSPLEDKHETVQIEMQLSTSPNTVEIKDEKQTDIKVESPNTIPDKDNQSNDNMK